MDKRFLATVIAVLSVYFWNQPFNNLGAFSQSGHHWGEIAYGFIILPAIFAISTFIKFKHLSIASSVLFLILTADFLLKFEGHLGSGLIGLAVCAIITIISVMDLLPKNLIK